MTLRGTLAFSLLLVGISAGQDEHECKDCKKTSTDWEGYRKGLHWFEKLDTTRAQASKETKLILYFRLAGDLDKEGC